MPSRGQDKEREMKTLLHSSGPLSLPTPGLIPSPSLHLIFLA